MENEKNINQVERKGEQKKKRKGFGLLVLVFVVGIAAYFGWQYKDMLSEKAVEIETTLKANKTMNDYRESNAEHHGEHTDRDEFDSLLWTLRPESSQIRVDSTITNTDCSVEYINSVFEKYTGIKDRSLVKFVSLSGPSWEEQFIATDHNDEQYSTDKFFAVLALANSEDDAKLVIDQMKENLAPWDWKSGDFVVGEDQQNLLIDIPQKEITKDDLNFYQNGAYILFVINDKDAIAEGNQKSFEYLTKLLDKAIEETKEYYNQK